MNQLGHFDIFMYSHPHIYDPASAHPSWFYKSPKSQQKYRSIATDFCRNCDNLSTLTTDTTSKLDILGHDSHTLGVDGTQVGVLEQSNKVSFGSFLERQNSGGLETEIGLEVLSNLTNKTLEGSLADKEIGRLLVLADLTESNSSRAITVGFLYTSGSRCGLTGSLSNQIRNIV